MEVLFTRRRITADQYERMVEVGILTEDDRVELIGGEIVEMAAQGARHVACIIRLDTLVRVAAGGGVYVSVQNALRLNDDTEPEPDLAVLRWLPDGTRLPEAADVLLLIEVADSTATTDRGEKLPRYAAAGIMETWLVDIQGERIERYSDPGAVGYRLIAIAGRGESLSSTVLPALVFDADAVLGPRQGTAEA